MLQTDIKGLWLVYCDTCERVLGDATSHDLAEAKWIAHSEQHKTLGVPPPCEYDGDKFFAFIGEVPLCLDCWEYAQDQAPIYSGIW